MVVPDSPHTPSPTRDKFSITPSPRSGSPQVNSLRNSASTTFHSPSSSPVPSDKDQSVGHATLRASSSTCEYPSRSASPITHDQARLSADGRSSPTLGPPNGHTIRGQKSFDNGSRGGPLPRDHRLSSNSNSEGSRQAIGSRSRPTSDTRRADVPHSVESGTDTEAEREDSASEHQLSGSIGVGPPPVPPPKDSGENTQPKELELDNSGGDADADVGKNAEGAHSLEEMEEIEGAQESTSIATFIAPALPPIRFSMTGADFSDMLKNVGGMPSLKSLDHLAKLTEEGSISIPSTPPPTAVDLPVTPSSDVTVTNGTGKPPPPVTRSRTLRKRLPGGSSDGHSSAEDPSRPSTSLSSPHVTITTPDSNVTRSLWCKINLIWSFVDFRRRTRMQQTGELSG